jgi:hypothetical protein
LSSRSGDRDIGGGRSGTGKARPQTYEGGGGLWEGGEGREGTGGEGGAQGRVGENEREDSTLLTMLRRCVSEEEDTYIRRRILT